MTTIHFRLLNVFAESTFGGNPLAVIEDGSALTDAQMQSIAQQFNLSETTFLLPSEKAAARVRIFTPSYEMPFAGHPTLGSAHVVRELFATGDAFALDLKAGVIPMVAKADFWTLQAGEHQCWPAQTSASQLADMLGLPSSAILGPAMWGSYGEQQLLIPLQTVDDVQACKPDPLLLKVYGQNDKRNANVYVFARTAEGYCARFFWLQHGNICEDPGTGSACANLGAWWLANAGALPLHARIAQGRETGRDNVLYLDVSTAGEIFIGGRVLQIGQGTLTI